MEHHILVYHIIRAFNCTALYASNKLTSYTVCSSTGSWVSLSSLQVINKIYYDTSLWALKLVLHVSYVKGWVIESSNIILCVPYHNEVLHKGICYSHKVSFIFIIVTFSKFTQEDLKMIWLKIHNFNFIHTNRKTKTLSNISIVGNFQADTWYSTCQLHNYVIRLHAKWFWHEERLL